jgi:predicted GH43/DUF377 family glycosyl hydrolase
MLSFPEPNEKNKTSSKNRIFRRSEFNPILYPNPVHEWESLKVYNPAAWHENDKIHLFYRAVGHGESWHSSIGYAFSMDAERFVRFPKPILSRDDSALELRGLEDPRIVKIDGIYFMSYAAYDGVNVRLCIATSNDLETWKKHFNALPDFRFTKEGGTFARFRDGKWIHSNIPKGNDERTKSGALFPEKINGKYWMLFGEYQMWLASSDDGIHYIHEKGPFMAARGKGFFDEIFIEAGPPPIKIDRGWLVLYHGIDNVFTYRLGYLILDSNNPKKVLYRSVNPIFEPEADYEYQGFVDVLPGGQRQLAELSVTEIQRLLPKYEHKGLMPKVAFCPGAILINDMVRLYYGASDTYVCTAVAPLKEILHIK